MSNVIKFNGTTSVKRDADVILEANKGNFDEIAFMGINKQGKFECGASFSELEKILVLIELFKSQIMLRLEEELIDEDLP